MKKEKQIRKLLGDYYHLGIEYKDNNIIKWSLYKKYKDLNIYFSKENQPIMTSENNTEEELFEFAKLHHRKDYNKQGSKIIRISLIVVLVISIINIFFNGKFTQFVLVSVLWLIIWMISNNNVFNTNWKVDMLELKERWERTRKKLEIEIDENANKIKIPKIDKKIKDYRSDK